MTNKFTARFLSLVVACAMIAGCGGIKSQAPASEAQSKTVVSKQTVYPITLKDGAGRSVTIAAEPKRIISVAPSNTEMVFALGKGSLLVGRSDFDDFPAEAKSVESIGGFFPPNFEKIVSLKPDLMLLVAGSVADRDKLVNDYKINVFVVDPQNFAALYESIGTLGQVLNSQEAATKVVGEMQKSVKEITDKTAKATTKPKVFYEVWNEPLMTAGTDTFVDELITMAGGINAGGDVKGWAPYSLEKLQAGNPDLLITGKDQVDKVKGRKGWEGIKAVKESKVLSVSDPNLVVRPGPRLVLGLKWFAETLHPELFK
jgi:iron complex transport system substrate-binding protein